jgi:hypothetical protein
MLGSMGISDLIIYLSHQNTAIGVDAIEVVLPRGAAKVNLLMFGDADRVEELIKEIGGNPSQRILGSGAVITGKVLEYRGASSQGQRWRL